MDFEALYADPPVVAAGANSRWVRRRKIELAELANELWALPAPDSAPGTFIMEVFRASGLELPEAKVANLGLPMRMSLMATGRFLTILPRSVLRYPRKHPFIQELRVELPITDGPIGIVTLRNRTLSPVTRLFVECAREIATPLPRRRQ
jgi:DNA-binding transcriptional LysR family regulator